VYVNGPGYAGLDGPSALALDGSHLYVVDSTDDDVVAIDLEQGEISLLAGQNGTPSAADGVGADAGFYTPTGIATDRHGNLYVCDNQSSTLRKIAAATATVSTIAGVSQRPGYQDGVGAKAFLGQPFAATANGLGDLFFSDSGNNAVRHLDLSTRAVTTVIGDPPLQGVRLGPLPAQITAPSAIALTPGGSLLFVSESSVLIAH
jgi:sugar lactone lactonase YvrE